MRSDNLRFVRGSQPLLISLRVPLETSQDLGLLFFFWSVKSHQKRKVRHALAIINYHTWDRYYYILVTPKVGISYSKPIGLFDLYAVFVWPTTFSQKLFTYTTLTNVWLQVAQSFCDQLEGRKPARPLSFLRANTEQKVTLVHFLVGNFTKKQESFSPELSARKSTKQSVKRNREKPILPCECLISLPCF